MSKCRQTKPAQKFTLIIDDSGHRKSGALTKGIGIQYIGEIGKTDNGIVMGTSHLYDGVRSLPLDVALYKHASSLPKGQDDKEFKQKPELALELIDKCDQRGHRPRASLGYVWR